MSSDRARQLDENRNWQKMEIFGILAIVLWIKEINNQFSNEQSKHRNCTQSQKGNSLIAQK